ncbi:hypothetical protein ONA70_31190 [Micromonospora yasonensis]|uniref:hypothetical protein n=1 Tax=Micromonospora yasonensis TaxID=1128667 RepID=UPI002231DD5C|nr:hypothetical protein [Micromonospora yasonensis]MCW3844553.1 hypothetical protein [Micromonospora yasonensis]
METLRALAVRLEEASATLDTLSRTVTAADPAHPAFGAHATGRPGEIGRALHRQWATATGDRAHEAHTAAIRLAAAASALREAADRYTATDESAQRRFRREA